MPVLQTNVDCTGQEAQVIWQISNRASASEAWHTRMLELLHEIQRDDNPTPRQAITKYTKSLSREERIKDRYPRGGIDDTRINKSLLNWLAISRLPDNLIASGALIDFVFEFQLYPRFKVPSRPYCLQIFQ